jgi:hypothetical protein
MSEEYYGELVSLWEEYSENCDDEDDDFEY